MKEAQPVGPAIHRRAFLERMGAALAAAGLPGCGGGEPPERIVPYVRQPEYIVPGSPLWFASSLVLGGYAQGVLVETHEGRPTKIEGDPEHPASLGGTDAFGQAAVRELYDPRRSTGVVRDGAPADWPEFLRAARPWLRDGRRAAILTRATTSRVLVDAVTRLQSGHPGVTWYAWEPVSFDAAHAGMRAVFAGARACHLRLDRARVVVSLDDDFLTWSPGRLRHARALAARRAPSLGEEALRLYVAESFPSITGAAADHRRIARVDEVPRLARALVAGLMGVHAIDDPWLAAAVGDLRRAGAEGLVVAGPQQPPQVHALAHAANHLLRSAGRTVVYTPRLELQPEDGVASLRALVEAIREGSVGALFILEGDPVRDAPADLEFAAALAAVPFTAYLGLFPNDTAEACRWRLPQAHALEAWGDARADEGTITLAQPTIRPLYGGLTPAELLGALADDPARGRERLERSFEGSGPGDERGWRAAIHDGRLPAPRESAAGAAIRPAVLASLLMGHEQEGMSEETLVIAFRPDPAAWDGRFVGDPWLQELPRPISRLMWGNAAFVAPATARAHGLEHEQVARVSVAGRAVEAPIYVLQGCPEGQITVHLGYGRELGFDAYRLRTSDGLWAAPGAAEPLERRARLIVDRHLAAEPHEDGAAMARWATRADYARAGRRAFAGAGAPDDAPPSLHPTRGPGERAWAMTIDLGACIGCGACVVACQAENNIPTVGPDEAARGRVMHWIRVDTYADTRAGAPCWRFQPVPCMQCEHAPCEVVCPTGATQHSHDGLNDMVYNRCVGTRYCSNNCPYKVRRFNFFDYVASDAVTLRLQRNPDVTVRTRGVMEKCTYCVQRIRGAEIVAIREGRPIPVGGVVTACQGACPAGAIAFGDLARPGDPVIAARREGRAYALLHELGTRPRTSYLARLHHPNPALVAEEEG